MAEAEQGKFKPRFRQNCLDLLSLMESISVPPSEKEIWQSNAEGVTTKGAKRILRKQGYHLKLEEIVDDIFGYHPDLESRYSDEYIRSFISDFIFDLKLNPASDKIPIIDTFRDSLKTKLEGQLSSYLIPRLIENLYFHSEIAIGKITFVPYSKQRYSQLLVDAGCSETEIIALPADLPNIGSIAVIEVVASEPQKAFEESDMLVEEALDVMRLFKMHWKFAVHGKFNEPRPYTTHIYDKTKNALTTSMGWVGLTSKCNISVEETAGLVSYSGFKSITKILQKKESDRTEMERKLVLAIRWFGEVIKHQGSSDDLARLFIALEALLISNRGGEKKGAVAERLAFINGKNSAERHAIYRLIRRSYVARNKLIHEGNVKFRSDDIYALLVQLRDGILNIVQRVENYPDLTGWVTLIDEAKFSTGLNFQPSPAVPSVADSQLDNQEDEG